MNVYACPLPGEALLHLRGNNIPGFLQGQLSCDMRRLQTERAVSGAFCNVKGRVISDLTVIQIDDEHCVLRLRDSLAANVANTLQRYAQFSRIAVTQAAEPAVIAGAYGELSGAASPLVVPSPDAAVERVGQLCFLRRTSRQMDIIDLAPEAPQALAALLASLPQGDPGAWQAECLRAGHYALEAADSERFTPQALNYDLTDRVAFNKGCYTGQEVIARLHYKGKSKRRLQIFELTSRGEHSGASLQPGAAIFDQGQAVGQVLRRESDCRGQCLIAAEIGAEHLGHELQSADGLALRPLTPAG